MKPDRSINGISVRLARESAQSDGIAESQSFSQAEWSRSGVNALLERLANARIITAEYPANARIVTAERTANARIITAERSAEY